MTFPRTAEPREIREILLSVGAILQLVDDQWEDLDDHERRSAVRISLEAARSYGRAD